MAELCCGRGSRPRFRGLGLVGAGSGGAGGGKREAGWPGAAHWMGVVEEPEWENGAWRYRFRTQRILLVVQFLSEDEVLVVTAWRTK